MIDFRYVIVVATPFVWWVTLVVLAMLCGFDLAELRGDLRAEFTAAFVVGLLPLWFVIFVNAFAVTEPLWFSVKKMKFLAEGGDK